MPILLESDQDHVGLELAQAADLQGGLAADSKAGTLGRGVERLDPDGPEPGRDLRLGGLNRAPGLSLVDYDIEAFQERRPLRDQSREADQGRSGSRVAAEHQDLEKGSVALSCLN